MSESFPVETKDVGESLAKVDAMIAAGMFSEKAFQLSCVLAALQLLESNQLLQAMPIKVDEVANAEIIRLGRERGFRAPSAAQFCACVRDLVAACMRSLVAKELTGQPPRGPSR